MNSGDDNIVLHEDEVPGASLRGRDVGSLKIPELKRWLQCRRASTKGLKADLVARYFRYNIITMVVLGNTIKLCYL